MTAAAQDLVGRELPVVTAQVERGRLRTFALAVGIDDPVYTSVDAARAAGHPDLPAPPTFLFGVGLGRGPAEDFGWLATLGIDLASVLHGEQEFTYHRLAYAGDQLTLTPRIVDSYTKRGGALRFLVRETVVTRDGQPVATLRDTIVVRTAAPVGEERDR